MVGRVGVVAVVAVQLSACGDGGDGAATADVGPLGLVGIEWQLVETSIDGTGTEVDREVDAVVRFDGEGGWSAEGCNYFGGDVEIDGMHLTFGDQGPSTDVACDGPVGDIDDAVNAVLDGEVDADIDDEELTLTAANGDWLRLEVRDGVFPSRTMIPLAEGQRGDGDYRFGYEPGADGPFALWEFRASPGTGWGFAGGAAPEDPHRPEPLGGAAEEPVNFVFGVIGADVARVTYEPPSGEVIELVVYPLEPDYSDWRAYGGFVEQPVAGSYVVAYDATGTELGRSVDLRWP